MHLFDLPSEMLVSILQRLSCLDILSCRQTCKLLHNAVDTNVAVQYILELGVSGKVDNTFNPSLYSKKLAELRRINESWANLHWKHRVGPIPIQNFASVYEFTGGYYFQDINASYDNIQDSPPRTISWLPLPRIGALGSQGWGQCTLDFRPADICIDVSRDLLVVIERLAEDNGYSMQSCIAHFLTISTNETHPDAFLPQVLVPFGATMSDHSMVVQLGGDHIGLLFSGRTEDNRDGRRPRRDTFHVWDWTKNVCKAATSTSTIERRQWDAFCFLSDSAILLPDTLSNTLDVYSFTAESDSFKQLASLCLPEIKSECHLHGMSVRCEPITRSPTEMYQFPGMSIPKDKLFHADPQAAIVIVTLEYILPPDGDPLIIGGFHISIPDQQVFAVKRSKLLELALAVSSAEQSTQVDDRTMQVTMNPGILPSPSASSTSVGKPVQGSDESMIPQVPLQKWIHHTRWGLAPVPSRYVCYVHGSRFISMKNRQWGSSKRMSIRLYDFNVRGERRAECLGQDYLPEDFVSAEGDDEDWGWEDEDEQVDFTHNTDGLPPTKISTPKRHPIASSRVFWNTQTVKRPDIFKETFKSSLPYRLIETRRVFDWDSVVLDEDHIIGFKESDPDTGILESFDVLVF